jgi:hypothetical protein
MLDVKKTVIPFEVISLYLNGNMKKDCGKPR